MAATDTILRVTDAVVTFGPVRALDGVSLEVRQGETLAVVGESGCGKTTLARSILGLQPLASGTIQVDGHVVRGASAGQASRIGMVWQDPFASVDPLWRVRRILQEPYRLAGTDGDLEQLAREVGLDPSHLDRYPHELSGGQRQRVAIGRALALRPPLVLCDEPTAALDLSIQAQILNLLHDIQQERGCALLYISHDLGTVRHVSDRVAVMYLGRVVETGPTEEVFGDPRHPYTKALADSAPRLESLGHLPQATKGEIPDPKSLGKGCRYASRCLYAADKCLVEDPVLSGSGGREAACFFPLGPNC